MRTIKFRGQRLDSNEWGYGCAGYGFNQNIQYIMPKMYFATKDFGEVDENENMILDKCVAIGGFIPIKPETVGQFTGLQDKNGVDIYKGDILEFHAKTCNFLPAGYCQEPYKKGQMFFVKQLDSGFTLSIFKIKDSIIPNQVGHVDNYILWNHHASFQIIGNIHENPELLNA